MGSASRSQGPLPKIPKTENFKNPSISSDTEEQDNLPVQRQSDAFKTPLLIDGVEEDSALSLSEYLTREEVLRRRSRRAKQLARFYREQYWALMEEIRVKYRDYYWYYGKSPFKEDQDEAYDGEKERNCENGVDEKSRLGLGFENSNGMIDTKENINQKKCAFPGCKTKAMALTSYCHPHILSDTKQKLYKPCIFPVGQVTCGKPILRAAVPSLCNGHLQKYQKNVLRALKKGGLNISSSSKSPKLSAIIAEYVKQIQRKRRESSDKVVKNVVVKEENGN
ncbi:hypothetical protein H6P81_013235 [Aristolochia fimbriata]|uniref:KAT8 regulatory NSL complex subunit 2 n=1 Tax=Aristolochia fimbriata TaxID=158543 RepID=A0AAV7EHE9_ARIFI|nr:hypothetical protein H6P81_013235 [Aristolochia fimbriata]